MANRRAADRAVCGGASPRAAGYESVLGSVLAALLSCSPGCGGARPARNDAAVIGASSVALHPAVDFAFDSLDDRPVTSAATRGKVTVLAFVTTGSLMAQAQVDFLVAMAKRDGQGVNYALVALEARENRELVELYRKTLGVTFPVAMADAATLSGGGPFGDVTPVPVTAILDRTGRVVLRVEARVAQSGELREAMGGL